MNVFQMKDRLGSLPLCAAADQRQCIDQNEQNHIAKCASK